MRARRDVILIATACVWAVGAGCASKKPAEETPITSTDRACAHDPSDPSQLPPVSPDTKGDPQIASILTRPTGDRRLMEINRRMYQSLHALDVELRREQRLAACEHQALDVRSDSAPPSAGGATTADGRGPGGSPGSTATPAAASAPAQSAMAAGVALGGGNGAIAPKITPGSDNDIVARRLRKAAEQEPDPTLRAKLWKEYTDYIHGTSAK